MKLGAVPILLGSFLAQSALAAKIRYQINGTQKLNCEPGYIVQEGRCLDIDECASGSHSCASRDKCTNTPGSFGCKCSKGYRGLLPICTDIDECKEDKTMCKFVGSNGIKCNNTLGSFDCVCGPGYKDRYYLADNTPTCSNYDECAANVTNCDAKAECNDTVGSFTCECKTGYKDAPGSDSPGTNCTDFDECRAPGKGLEICLKKGQICRNTVGSFECNCKPGYFFDAFGACKNEHECSSGTHTCPTNSTWKCVDTEGSFKCECNDGWGGENCTDVDECALHPGICERNANTACNNTNGSYECACKEGYAQSSANYIDCKNIDECSTEKNQTCITENATCSDTPGSFKCWCQPGFAWQNSSCQEIDECELKVHNCFSAGQVCENTNGSFTCGCKAGWEHNNDSTSCLNIDECAANTSTCHPIGGECKDTKGSFTCACTAGYLGDGMTCVDRDECQQDKSPCVTEAYCNNTNGSFTCTCKTGFVNENGTDNKCLDIDECAAQANDTAVGGLKADCHSNASCTNSYGSFYCSCNAGFEGFGSACSAMSLCSSGVARCPAHTTCNDTGIGTFECNCRLGYENISGECKDIDECANATSSNASLCTSTAKCINTRGSFGCVCNQGYQGNGTVCTDIDECELQEDNCHREASCNNTNGSFTCSCNVGYNGTGVSCADVDECQLATTNETNITCTANHTCSNTIGSYRCHCKGGYEYSGAGTDCADIDECERFPNACDPNVGSCTNTVGSFTCACPTGYKPVQGGKACQSQKTIEVGQFDISSFDWLRVEFTSAFVSPPVVVLLQSSANENIEYSPRVFNVTRSAFYVAVSIPNSAGNISASHPQSWVRSPTMSYMAVAKGANYLPDGPNGTNGTLVQAGIRSVSKQVRRPQCGLNSNTSWDRVSFQQQFNSTPVVFAQIQGNENLQWKGGQTASYSIASVSAATNGTLEIAHFRDDVPLEGLTPLQKGYRSHEEVGWIAVETTNRSNLTYENRTVSFISAPVDNNGTGTVGDAVFSEAFSAAPIVLADWPSTFEGRIGYLQYSGSTTNKALFKVRNNEGCQNQTSAKLNFFAADSSFSV